MEYQTSLQQGIYDKQQDIYDEQQEINDKSRSIMVSLVPSSFTSPANQWIGIGRYCPSQWLTPHRERWASLWEQAGVSGGNKERGPQGYSKLVYDRRGTARLLAERPGRDRKVNHRPNVRRDDLQEWNARCQLLLFARLRGPQQSSDDLPNARLPARLSISIFSKGAAGGLEGTS